MRIHTSVGHHWLNQPLSLLFSGDLLEVDVFVVAGDIARDVWLHSIELDFSRSAVCLSIVRCMFRLKLGSIAVESGVFICSEENEDLLCYVERRVDKLQP